MNSSVDSEGYHLNLHLNYDELKKKDLLNAAPTDIAIAVNSTTVTINQSADDSKAQRATSPLIYP